MRGMIAVIMTSFVSIILFGLFAPAVLEPVAEVVVNNEVVQSASYIDIESFRDGLFNTIFKWSVLFVLGASVVFGVRWYLRRERLTGRRLR